MAWPNLSQRPWLSQWWCCTAAPPHLRTMVSSLDPRARPAGVKSLSHSGQELIGPKHAPALADPRHCSSCSRCSRCSCCSACTDDPIPPVSTLVRTAIVSRVQPCPLCPSSTTALSNPRPVSVCSAGIFPRSSLKSRTPRPCRRCSARTDDPIPPVFQLVRTGITSRVQPCPLRPTSATAPPNPRPVSLTVPMALP